MVVRILTSIVGLIVFFAAFLADEFIFCTAAAVVSVGMVCEAIKAVKPGKAVTAVSIFLSSLFFLSVITLGLNGEIYKSLYNPETVEMLEKLMLLLFFAVYVVLAVFLYLILTVKYFNKIDFSKIYSSAFLNLYITVFMSFILLLRADYGRYAVLAVFMFAWITDTGAYFSGRFLGRHKLAPNLSPKKTVEGAIGGVVLSVVAGFVYIWALNKFFGITLGNNTFFIAAAGVGAVLSELGDLVASAVKRQCGIKDFGRIFPGHGGLFDRFDSVVFIAPFVYMVFTLMQFM